MRAGTLAWKPFLSDRRITNDMRDGSDLPIPLEESMVLVLGETGAGKSFFVRKLTLSTDVRVGHYLESCSYLKMKAGSMF